MLRMSINSLKRRKLRTFLTVLGVVIGTASIVVMISLGVGLQESMYAQVEESGGATNITVTGKESEGEGSASFEWHESEQKGPKKYITDEVVNELGKLKYVKSSDPVLNFSAVALKGNYQGTLDLYGTTQEGLRNLRLELDDGSKIPDPESSQLQLIYGNTVLTSFMDKGTGKGYWETGEAPDIDLKNDPLFLVLDQDAYYQSQTPAQPDSTGGSGSGNSGAAPVQKIPTKYVVTASGVIKGGLDSFGVNSSQVYCDVNKLREFLQREFRGRAIPGQPKTKNGKPYSKFVYSSAKVQVDDIEHVDAVSDLIRSLGYNVTTNTEYIDSMKKQFAMVQAVLGGIGAVSLFVAAIGIANTMMMSIYERTKEIGVMKVIGCGLKNIRQMFLMEAAFIGLTGGIIGNILSILVSLLINSLVSGESIGVTGNISSTPPWLFLISIGFAMLVGTAAGYFPARRAMSLSPLAAIRGE